MARVIAAAHPASSALHALKTDFRVPGTDDLIISKGTSLEVHALDPTGLRLALEIPLNGSIAALASVRRPSGARLLVLTTSKKLIALAYAPAEPGSVRCESSVTVSELAGRLAEDCQTILVDELNRCIIVHLYVGFIRVFPSYDKPQRGSVKSKTDSESRDALDLTRNYNIRLPEPNIRHLAFLPLGAAQAPTLGLLYLTHNGDRAFNTRCISLEDKELVPGPVNEILLNDAGSNFFVPFGAPLGDESDLLSKSGVAIVGEESVTVVSLGSQRTGSPGKGKGKAREHKATVIATIKLPIGEYRAFCAIDDATDAFLVGDLYGSLNTLRLMRTGGYVTSTDFETIGQTSSAMSLVYLANQFIFVASHYGDSQLCRLPSGESSSMVLDDDHHEQASRALDVVTTFANLAPISDFCVVDIEGYGQSHVVTCSGAYSDGSLRIVRHGVGLSELGMLDMDRVQRVWALRPAAAVHDSILLLSYVNETRVFRFGAQEGELEELESFGGFILEMPTLHACVLGDASCQVTESGVLLSIAGTLAHWQPPSGKQITLAAHNDSLLLAAVDGGELHLLDLSPSLSTVASTLLSNDASCATMHTFPGGRQIAIVTTWASHELALYSLPDMHLLLQIPLETMYLPRSVLTQTFADGATHLFIGLGDGTLVNFILSDEAGAKVLRQDSKKMVTLGQRPISLAAFAAEDGGYNVLACTDRPTVISRSSGRLTYASVNLRDINVAVAFNPASFGPCLVLVSPTSLRFGRIDDMRKLHIRTVTLGAEQPQRIVHSMAARAYGVLCLREVLDRRTGAVDRQASFKILDDIDFGVLVDFELEPSEQGQSLCTAPLGDPTAPESFIIGTAVIEPDSIDSKAGRLVAYSHLGEGKFQKVGEQEVDGAVYAIARLPGGRIAAAVNSRVIALGWHGVRSPYATAGFEQLADWASFFLATTLSSRLASSQLVVGDALRSMVLLQYDHETHSLIEIGREHSAYGITAVASLDVDTLLGAEDHFNLYTLQLGSEANVHGGELPALVRMGMYHLGEFVTKFVPGSIVPTFAQSSSGAMPNLLYATSTGSIGVIADLDLDSAKVLSDLQRNMRKVLPSLGGLDHEDWRTFRSANRTHPPVGFIDGAYIEQFAYLSSEQAEAVLAGKSGHERITEDRTLVTRLVETLEQLH